MTALTTRNEIVKTKRVIGSELTKMQKAFYDEEMLQYYKDDNEEHLYWEQFDCINNEEIDYSTFNKIISIDHTNIDTFTNKLTEKLTELFKTIDVTDFIIISHLKLDFFGNRDNDFKPLRKHAESLKKSLEEKLLMKRFKLTLTVCKTILRYYFGQLVATQV